MYVYIYIYIYIYTYVYMYPSGPGPAQAQGRARAGPGPRGTGLGTGLGRTALTAAWYAVFILYVLDIPWMYIWVLTIWYMLGIYFLILFYFVLKKSKTTPPRTTVGISSKKYHFGTMRKGTTILGPGTEAPRRPRPRVSPKPALGPTQNCLVRMLQK